MAFSRLSTRSLVRFQQGMPSQPKLPFEATHRSFAAGVGVVPEATPMGRNVALAAAAVLGLGGSAWVMCDEPSPKFKAFLKKAAEVKKSNPDNLCTKHLTEKYFKSLNAKQQEVLYKCCLTGVENADSGVGCYAMTPDDYDTLAPFFDEVVREYHRESTGKKIHSTNWDISKIGNKGVLDVTKLGLDTLSMRVRVGRNLKNFPLPGMMTREQRIEFEKGMLKAFKKLQAMDDYGGQVYSLTPDFGNGEANPNLITAAKYAELVKSHVMFKNMDDDPYLKTAGIASDWPYGRGCYISKDKQFIVWFGEEDHLRVMSMKKGTCLNEVFNRLKAGLDVVESIDGLNFATSKKYGYVTSCPSNLGTGMRASVHIKIPNLCSDGTDTKAKQIAKPLGLSIRGTGGEHTPIGADGTVDVSPNARLFISEAEIVGALYQGIKDLMAEEKKAAK